MKSIYLTRGKFAIVDDGDFMWIRQWKWYATANGYARRDLNKKHIWMHRLIMNAPKHVKVDHRNGDGFDNRRSNLRNCSNKDNCRNSKIPKNNTSGYKGVYLNKKLNKWASGIKVDRKAIYLGLFNSKEEAAKAYDYAAKEYFGNFAKLNFKDILPL